VRGLRDAAQDDDVDYHENRWALEVLCAVVPMEMASNLVDKTFAKAAWDAIASSRIGSYRARKSTLQKLSPEWDRLAFKPGENVENFALHLSSLMQQMVQYGGDDIDKEKAIDKFLRVVPRKYTQVAISIEMLLDLSTLSIEEVTGRFKAVAGHHWWQASLHRGAVALPPGAQGSPGPWRRWWWWHR
jgi:hypothetical protein